MLGRRPGRWAEDAVAAYWRMREQEGLRPNVRAVVAALKQCSSSRDVENGRRIHRDVMDNGDCFHVFVANTLVDMYSKCGSLAEARLVFDSIRRPTTVSWNCMINGYAHNGQAEAAVQLYDELVQSGGAAVVEQATVLAALRACAALLDQGKLTRQECLVKSRAIGSTAGRMSNFVGSRLVDMYARCRSLDEARQVFEAIDEPDLVSWTTLIQGYSQAGQPEVSLQLFARMVAVGSTVLDAIVVVAAAGACARLELLERGRAVHSQAATAAVLDDKYVSSALVDMYAKCGAIDDAVRLFQSSEYHYHDAVSWTTVISARAMSGQTEAALELYAQMRRLGVVATPVTFVAVIKACTSGSSSDKSFLKEGRAVHWHAAQEGHATDSTVVSTLVDMYAKYGRLTEAREVFNAEEAGVAAWTSLISGYAAAAAAGDDDDSRDELRWLPGLELYRTMQLVGVRPNSITFLAALKACHRLEEGRMVHGQATESGHDTGDVLVANALMAMYARCGSLAEAAKVFESLDTGRRDVVSWTTMIMASSASEETSHVAMSYYDRMRQQPRQQPNALTLVAALRACAHLADVRAGRRIHAEAAVAGLDRDPLVAHSLVELYSKCGDMNQASKAFDHIAKDERSVATWSALITGYGRQGDSPSAIACLDEMLRQGLRPDGLVFLALLAACNHGGDVEQGRAVFKKMAEEFGVAATAEHYAVMVDLLGRGNELEEAVAMVKTMPMKADEVVWTSLMAAARKWGDVGVAKMSFEALLEMDARNGAAYALMASVYARAGRRDEEAKVQAMRARVVASKEAGRSSWTDEKGTVHSFAALGKTIEQGEQRRV